METDVGADVEEHGPLPNVLHERPVDLRLVAPVLPTGTLLVQEPQSVAVYDELHAPAGQFAERPVIERLQPPPHRFQVAERRLASQLGQRRAHPIPVRYRLTLDALAQHFEVVAAEEKVRRRRPDRARQERSALA